MKRLVQFIVLHNELLLRDRDVAHIYTTQEKGVVDALYLKQVLRVLHDITVISERLAGRHTQIHTNWRMEGGTK